MAITGALGLKTSTSLGGSIAIAGATGRTIALGVGSGSIAIASTVVGQIVGLIVGGGSIAIAGSIGRGFWHPIIERVRSRFPTRYKDPTRKISGYEDPRTRYKYPSDYE